MTQQLVDYAWTKPTPAQIVAGGYVGVLRYLSNDSSKNLSIGERDALLTAGLSIGLVWETTATRASQGFAVGKADALTAEAQADALGYPVTCPLFYAVDYDATPTAVIPYFQGITSVARRPVGVYGSANIVEGIPAPWKWQTVAWSKDRISAQAHIFQTTLPTLSGCDLNKVLRPVPLWSTDASSSTQTNTQEDDMASQKYLYKFAGHPAVFFGDLETCRWVKSEAEAADLNWEIRNRFGNTGLPVAGPGVILIATNVPIRVLGRKELIGVIEGSVPTGW